jgi:hypothetical protein
VRGTQPPRAECRTLIVRNPVYGPAMDMVTGEHIADYKPADWRKLLRVCTRANWSATSAPA